VLAHFKEKKPSEVRLIDPSTTETIRRFYERGEEASQYMKEIFSDDVPLLLMPISDNVHWSLLYYRRGADHWIHMDSLAPLHNRLAHAILDQLHRMKLTRVNQMIQFECLPRQASIWECGTFTLLYMLTVMLFNDAEIQASIGILQEERRQKLCLHLRQLLQIIV
jgi:Ulp1 family protease